MKKIKAKHIWLALAAYGVWFALFSGLEEVLLRKIWKVLLSLALGIFVFIIIELKQEGR